MFSERLPGESLSVTLWPLDSKVEGKIGNVAQPLSLCHGRHEVLRFIGAALRNRLDEFRKCEVVNAVYVAGAY